MIQGCIARLSSLLQDCTVTIKDVTPVEGLIDPVLLGRVLGLVIDNAVKYGRTPADIHIEYGEGSDKEGFIGVMDNGLGIPVAQSDAIFFEIYAVCKRCGHRIGFGDQPRDYGFVGRRHYG